MTKNEKKERKKNERKERKENEKKERKKRNFITILCRKCKTTFDVDREHSSVIFKLCCCTHCGHENKWDIHLGGDLEAGSFRQRMQQPLMYSMMGLGILFLFFLILHVWRDRGPFTACVATVFLTSIFLFMYFRTRICIHCRKVNAMRKIEILELGNSWESRCVCKHCGREKIVHDSKRDY
jgi:hypothetical protein